MADPETLDPTLADLATRVKQALAAADLPAGDVAFERPRQVEHGDWASTIALRLAKPAKRPPREIAQTIVDNLELPPAVAAVEVAGPGFINFRFAHAYFEDLVRRIVDAGGAYGSHTREGEEREYVNVEFVSANPTGPLHVGNGRWAATGDAIAALIEADGHRVVREYYVNDAGEQVRRFGESVLLTARGEPLGDDHYKGAYIADIAEQLRTELGDDFFVADPYETAELPVRAADGPHDLDTEAADVDPGLASKVGELAVRAMRDRIADVLHRMGVDFDVWFSERTLHERNEIDEALDTLRAGGHTEEADGALFLRTTDFGDDKDRVLVRSDGRPTYFAADCAYMLDKWRRGYSRLIYLLGADHHGYVARLQAVAQALGIPADKIEVRIGQLVNLLRAGEPVRLSKRSGEIVTLDEVVDEVGVDVTRYHFLRQSLDTAVDFDLDEVVKQSMENPVYYVQYAHARIASLIRTADERGFDHGQLAETDLTRLTAEAETELLRRMAELPEVIADAAELRATQRVTRYAEELAAAFHRFYTDCRVLVDDESLGRARYWLAVAAKQVLANALGVLRVAAPERM